MTSQPEIPVTFVDNQHAPDVFADFPTGIAFFGGTIRITFESHRISHVSSPGPVNKVVIGRLVLPLQGAKALADLLSSYLSKIQGPADTVENQGPTTLQ